MARVVSRLPPTLLRRPLRVLRPQDASKAYAHPRPEFARLAMLPAGYVVELPHTIQMQSGPLTTGSFWDGDAPAITPEESQKAADPGGELRSARMTLVVGRQCNGGRRLAVRTLRA